MFVRSICGYMWNGIIMLLVVVLSYYLGVQVKHIISAASCWHTLFKIISNQVLSHLFPKTLTSARTSTLLRSIPEMYLMSPHSLQAPASTYSSSNSDRTLTPPCPGPDNSTSQSAPLLKRTKTHDGQLQKQHFLIKRLLYFCLDNHTSSHRECRECQPGPEEWGILLAAWPMLQSLCCPESLAADEDQQQSVTSKGKVPGLDKCTHSNTDVMREVSLLVEGCAVPTLCCFTCGPCWGWGTSRRLRDLRCLLLTGVTGRYMEDSENTCH